MFRAKIMKCLRQAKVNIKSILKEVIARTNQKMKSTGERENTKKL